MFQPTIEGEGEGEGKKLNKFSLFFYRICSNQEKVEDILMDGKYSYEKYLEKNKMGPGGRGRGAI